ncbi:hypothetical protein GCM10007939_01010 [Amylibacter marinus]|uniref:DUF2330 domain-containing protein n=1 Tax=Amylibacter marinus TaxID=1475483 RepID=A0ABQ5VQY0_9RHOB|nr:DUF2330 domain-containing protein [Amylibacter marinus]GLQ33818.1 hypothetical protein GCM10007939_01010 [Amylibacter marinus]
MRLFAILIAFVAVANSANAFCGFYVAKADGELFNEASKVIFVRDGRKSTITMSSDYRGPAKDFAMIVPTPKVLKREQVKTVSTKTVNHLDAYTAPRLVEYFDNDPCRPPIVLETVLSSAPMKKGAAAKRKAGARALGVTIKAEYAVGIYDISILAAKQSNGLVTFLRQENYKIPDGAEPALDHYIKNGMKFFVARVNLIRHAKSKYIELEPLQIKFKSSKFMLPIQLGKVNSAGTQDMLMLALTRTGQVETKNYATKKIPSNVNIPSFVESEFANFYKSMFAKSVGKSGIVMEYAWDMAWCDPCAADPLSVAQLQELGVDWLKGQTKGPARDVFVTRLHARYSKDTMQQDLEFKETKNRANFQGRYVMNQPFTGAMNCPMAKDYITRKRRDIQHEAQMLADITGWSMGSINKKIAQSVPRKFR